MSSIPRQQHRQLPHNTAVTTSRNNILCHVTRDTLQLAHYELWCLSQPDLDSKWNKKCKFIFEWWKTHNTWHARVKSKNEKNNFRLRAVNKILWVTPYNTHKKNLELLQELFPFISLFKGCLPFKLSRSLLLHSGNYLWFTASTLWNYEAIELIVTDWGWVREKIYGIITFNFYTMPNCNWVDQPRSDKFKKGKFISTCSPTSLITLIYPHYCYRSHTSQGRRRGYQDTW